MVLIIIMIISGNNQFQLKGTFRELVPRSHVNATECLCVCVCAWQIKRDSTGLFESYHLRPEVAAAPLRRLPVLEGFPVSAVPRAPYPNDSKLYNTIRERCRVELFSASPPLSPFPIPTTPAPQ
jgi:hypothetical protein